MKKLIGFTLAAIIVVLSLSIFFEYPSDDVIEQSIDEIYVYDGLMAAYKILKKYDYESDRDWEAVLARIRKNEDELRQFVNPLTKRPIYVRKLVPTSFPGNETNIEGPFLYTNVEGSKLEAEFFAIDLALKPMLLDNVDQSQYFGVIEE